MKKATQRRLQNTAVGPVSFAVISGSHAPRQTRPYEKCTPGPAFQSRLGIGHRKNRTGGNSPNHARAEATLSSAAWFELGVTFPQIRLGVALRRLVLPQAFALTPCARERFFLLFLFGHHAHL